MDAKRCKHLASAHAESERVIAADPNVFASIGCQVTVCVPVADVDVVHLECTSRLVVGDVSNLGNCVTDGGPASALSHCVLRQLATVQCDSEVDYKQDEEKEQRDDEGKLGEGLAFLVTVRAGAQATFPQECQGGHNI